MSAMHTISVDVSDALYRRPDTVAEHDGQSRHLDTDDTRHQQTLAALADVDAGRTLTEAEMDAWMTKAFGPSPVTGEPV